MFVSYFQNKTETKATRKQQRVKAGGITPKAKRNFFCVLPWLHGYFSFLLMEEYKNTCILCILISLINKLILL